MVKSSYLAPVFENNSLRLIVDAVAESCLEIAENYKRKNDTELSGVGLVGRGLSGAMVIPSVALTLDWPFVMVRKEDGSHAYDRVEGNFSASHFIFVDDFVVSGETFAIVNTKMMIYQDRFKPIGCVFYRGDHYCGCNYLTELIIPLLTKDACKQCNYNYNNIEDIKQLNIKRLSVATKNSLAGYGKDNLVVKRLDCLGDPNE